MLDCQVLDGRNRYKAAASLGIEVPVVDFDGPDPMAFVIARNLHRRHLTESQRAMVTAKLATLPSHRPAHDGKSANLRTSEASKLLNVSSRSVESARVVQRDAIPELQRAVEQGEVAVSAAAAVAKLPAEEQRAVVKDGPAAVRKAAKTQREKRKSGPAKPAPPAPSSTSPADDDGWEKLPGGGEVKRVGIDLAGSRSAASDAQPDAPFGCPERSVTSELSSSRLPPRV